jgi:hypothetical protein
MFKTSATILKGLVALFIGVGPVRADPPAPPCVEDAMIVFDASGSMGGNLDQGIATLKPRIDEVRSALAEVLPSVTRIRRVGLITYGPGPAQAANVLDYRNSPGVIVVLTDGEETCGTSPCDLGKELRASAAQLTVHVVGFRLKDFSWTGEQSILDGGASPSRITGSISVPKTGTISWPRSRQRSNAPWSHLSTAAPAAPASTVATEIFAGALATVPVTAAVLPPLATPLPTASIQI